MNLKTQHSKFLGHNESGYKWKVSSNKHLPEKAIDIVAI